MTTEKPPDQESRADSAPLFRSHYRPRTRTGRKATIAFVLLFLLAQPPWVHGPFNRIEPWLLGVPFLYAYLSVLYLALMGVLVWAAWRNAF